MTKIFTQNDVLRYLYNETSQNESEALEGFLSVDSNLRDFYMDMLEVKEDIEKVNLKAPDRVIENILSYSRSKLIQFQQD